MERKANLLKAKEVSEYLGIPLRTIHRLSKIGKIKCFKIGGQWFYRKEDIDNHYVYGTDFRSIPARRVHEPTECREYQRINCDIDCSYSVNLGRNNGKAKGKIMNISGGGLFLQDERNAEKIKINDPLNLEFELGHNGNKRDIIGLSGRVVRKTSVGFGVKFRNIKDYFREMIIQYVG